MQFSTEYNWLDSYLANDSLWLEDGINWDNTFDSTTLDYNLFSFSTTTFFSNSHFFLDSTVKFSFLDLLFLTESNKTSLSYRLFTFWTLDSSFFSNVSFLPLQILFYTDYQDFIILILHHSPELVFAIMDFINLYWLSFSMSIDISAVFDVYNDSLSSTISEVLDYLTASYHFSWGALICLGSSRLLRWSNSVETYVVRILTSLFSISRDYRFQFEAVLKTIFIYILYITVMIVTFDDDQEELMETFTNGTFYVFLGVFIYFLYKYSIHYFSFLAASDTKKDSASLISQFITDILDTVGLLLRFLVLMARLNLYDFLDDLLDSYYLFVGDFDEDDYSSDLLFSISSLMFFDTDEHDDTSFFFEDEIDSTNDLFSLYFILWSKFSLFLFFSVEECLRVLLAFFITYLIIFEVQAVNRSYTEETYFLTKRQKIILQPKKTNNI